MKLKMVASVITFSALAVALTLTTVVFAPLPLILLRRREGRLPLLISSLVVVALLVWAATPVVWACYLGSAILAIVLCESENQNLGYTASVFVSLLVIAGFAAIVMGYSIEHFGFDPVGFFRGQINQGLAQLSLPSGITIDKEALVRQIPSALVILIIFSIWMNSVLAPRIERLLGWAPVQLKHTFVSHEFRSWKLPDAMVWLALLSVAGTFLDVQPDWVHWLAANTFNVVVMLYFFQGLAVIVDFFAVKQVAPLWRTVAYLLIFSQLFLMVAFLGFADLWLGFRNRTKTDKSAVA